MKTFEEKWTAWLDDQLTGRDLAEFEASLPDKAAAAAEKHSAHQLGTLLKEQLGAHPLSNEDFFSHQLRERIGRDEASTSAASATTSTWWSIPRLFWTGATSLAAFVVCAVMVIHNRPAADHSQYLTQILNARVDPNVSPNATVSIFEAKEDKVTVLWVDGLQSLPSEFAAK